MALQPILATGINGLVGSKLAQDFGHRYSFETLDVSDPVQPVDITNESQVRTAFEKSQAQFVVHFAAFTDVTVAWQQNGDTSGVVYRVNVTGTENILKAAADTGKHVIHISTAYVFNGEKDGLYTETDQPQAIEWYGQTKQLAEEAVQAATVPWTILRIDQPFRSDAFPKADIVRRIVSGLKTDTLYPQFTNHYFGPTFIDDFAKVIDWVIRSKTTGLFHASSGEQWNDFEFTSAINTIHKLNKNIKPGDLDDYLKTSNRPYQRNTALDTSKLKKQLDFELLSIKTALERVIL